MNPVADFHTFGGPLQAHIDWLRKSGVSVDAMIHPDAFRLAYGHRGSDGRLEPGDGGEPWLSFLESDDVAFWQPRTGKLASLFGRCFALGQDVIDRPETYSFDCALNIFGNPLEWLRARRDGCVVLDWSRAFDRLRDAPRVAVAESVLLDYQRAMKPPRLPETYVIARGKVAA